MRARLRSQGHKLKQTPWQLSLPYRHARQSSMIPFQFSTLPALSERATLSSLAGLRQARLWNCWEAASALIEWSQIHLDNSSWSLPAYPLETTS
jgi:hypothetical protein